MKQNNTVHFHDTAFMTASEKHKVLSHWKAFLMHGLKREHFTKRLYQHLHLHCGFIAHYSLYGFYSTYFESGQDTQLFFEMLCSNINVLYGAGYYNDINMATLEVYQSCKTKIQSKELADVEHSLNLMEACLKRARVDQDFAREFLTKIRM